MFVAMDDEQDQTEEDGARIVVMRTRGEKLCDNLRDDAKTLLEGLDSLDFGIEELGLKDKHQLFGLLCDARAALEHIAWLLGTQMLRDEIHVDEEDDDDLA
jgi:hypothetical protein